MLQQYLYGGRTVSGADILPDNYDDVLGQKLQRLKVLQLAKAGWLTEKERLRRDLERMSPYFGYLGIEADPRDYILQRIGQSYQYDVPPPDKCGHLQRFRGMGIRVMRLYRGVYRRWLRVGPANPLDVLQVNEPTLTP